MSIPPPKQIYYKGTALNYRQMGEGKKVLLAFHGFGQNSKNFSNFLTPLNPYYTIYIFDHFFHGESNWDLINRENPLSREIWKEIMTGFFENENIETCDILAFSLGGKLALATLEKYPQKINRLFLIAPDGLRINFWYYLATSNRIIQKCFKRTITQPAIFFKLLDIIYRLGIINRSLLKFVNQQMETTKKRWQVYFTWMLFRKLNFKLKKISNILDQHNIQLYVFFGKYDHIFPPHHFYKILKPVPNKKIYVLNTGHNGILKLTIPEIKSILYSATTPPS